MKGATCNVQYIRLERKTDLASTVIILASTTERDVTAPSVCARRQCCQCMLISPSLLPLKASD